MPAARTIILFHPLARTAEGLQLKTKERDPDENEQLNSLHTADPLVPRGLRLGTGDGQQSIDAR
jgi:hypothetical protein